MSVRNNSLYKPWHHRNEFEILRYGYDISKLKCKTISSSEYDMQPSVLFLWPDLGIPSTFFIVY